jgi:hypothetical protein
VPIVSPIEVLPEIAEAGEPVTVRGHDRLSGPVTLTSNGRILPGGNMANGVAEFTISTDAEPGSYFVEVVGANGQYAGGRVQITDGSGLWIHADRSFVAEGSPARLTVEAFGIPDDALALVSVEDGESGTFATLVPASDGRLVLVRPTDPTATWDGPTGRMSTDPQRDKADARIDVESEWEFSMQMEVPSPEGPLLWDYEGSFVVDDDGFISGEATGNYNGLRSCEVRENGVLTFKEEPVEVLPPGRIRSAGMPPERIPPRNSIYCFSDMAGRTGGRPFPKSVGFSTSR